jgi:superfamily I DNA and/or RNA helicase
MDDAQIIFGTLGVTGSRKFQGREFDYLIVDEACQSQEMELLIALQLNPKNIVLVGDQKQLPPTVMTQNHQFTKFSRSLFERLLNCNIGVTMLKE